MPRLPILLLLLSVALPSLAMDPGDDPLAQLADAANNYAQRIAKAGAGPFPAERREALFASARLLKRSGDCALSLRLYKAALRGVQRPVFEAWMRVAMAAQCARDWDNAANAAYLALQRGGDAYQRGRAVVVLGAALGRHWRYGNAQTLAAYQQVGGELLAAISPEAASRMEKLQQAVADAQRLHVGQRSVEYVDGVPSVCVRFDESLDGEAKPRFGDYIRFEPAFDAVFRRSGSREICADGAAFGVSYQVTVLPGLVSEAGNRMLDADIGEVTVSDREPSLWFENSLYVLPRNGGGIPVHAMNVGQVKLSLFRIGERNLVHDFVRENFLTDINGGQQHTLADKLGEQVWQGSATLSGVRNQQGVSNLPIAPLTKLGAGVYVLTARIGTDMDGVDADDDDGWTSLATQWLVVSDIGLSSYQGGDGLTVVSRSLRSAEPLPGVKLLLYGRNNEPLGELVSDASGRVHFPAAQMDGDGGKQPALLMAFTGAGDFNFLDISGSAFDLSDRGVGGRALPTPLDAFVYTERGVYRPGEQVQLTALLRDDGARAVNGLPLTLRLRRPDGQVVVERLLTAAHQNATGTAAGGYATELSIAPMARTGRWLAQVFVDTDADPVGQTSFLVEHIIPPRLELNFPGQQKQALQPGEDFALQVQARYLFGAPASGRPVSATVSVIPDDTPFPAFAGYRFGPGPGDDPGGEGEAARLHLDEQTTDAEGQATLTVRIDKPPGTRRPLKLQIRAEVSDIDGRVAANSVSLPLHYQPLLLGIKPAGDGTISEQQLAGFEIVALDAQGNPQASSDIHYRLIEEQADYQWYRQGSQWRYRRQTRDRLVEQGPLAIPADGRAQLTRKLAMGEYRLELSNADGSAFSSARLQVGWQSAGGGQQTPDRLRVLTDRDRHLPGSIAQLQIESPFSGRAQLVIATDRVLSIRELDLPQRQATIEVEVDPAWGVGAYALITAFQPDSDAAASGGARAGHGPGRAIGVAWLGIDPGDRKLSISLDAPARVRPRQTITVSASITGQAAATPVYMTLAAVDDGVLQLSGYQPPDPLAHYFAQRRLGVDIRDLYGRLIDARKGSPTTIRSGAGASGRKGAPDSHVKIVSLFSGVLRPDAQGRVSIPLALPDFNGRLRLMAVAWSDTGLGHAIGEVTVRDPVVVMPSLPRFMAVGDRSRASVLLRNVDGPAGDYQISWRAAGGLALGAGPTQTRLTLARGQAGALDIPLSAQSAGTGSLTIALHGPGDTAVSHSLSIGIREPFLPQTRRRIGVIGGGAEVTLGRQLSQGLRSDTLDSVISVSSQPNLDVPGLLSQLDLYPYGCLEQVTSRAFPLLDLDWLARRWDYHSSQPVAQRLSDAVQSIVNRQTYDGSFALWRPGGNGEQWLSAYAMDFLQRAREAGVRVPDSAWRHGLDWLREQVEYPARDGAEDIATQAYALYVLARTGEAHSETARYLVNEIGARLPGPMVAAHLGAALALMGEQPGAARAFALAGQLTRKAGLGDYGSELRDLAGRVQLQAEAQGSAGLAAQVQRLAESLSDRQWLSTQEQTWLVRAARAVTGDRGELALKVDQRRLPPRRKPLVLQPAGAALAAGLDIANSGPDSAWYSASVSGSPVAEPRPLQAGLHIERNLFSLDGDYIAPDEQQQIVQGDLLVVVIDGGTEPRSGIATGSGQLLIVDPLPAGLEIENASLANAHEIDGIDWLKLSETRYQEALDDRFVAALDLQPTSKGKQQQFRIAYLVRAVSPGRFRMPPVEVEDMYRPRYRARAESGWLQVAPAR